MIQSTQKLIAVKQDGKQKYPLLLVSAILRNGFFILEGLMLTLETEQALTRRERMELVFGRWFDYAKATMAIYEGNEPETILDDNGDPLRLTEEEYGVPI